METLDILYICDDNFAEIAGVSMTSLFANNPADKMKLHVYLLGVGLHTGNIEKFRALAVDSGQRIDIIDAAEEFEKIQALKLDTYRGSAMTNLRLHFDKLIPESVHKVLYIDCDTIVCDSLTAIAQMPLDGKLVAMAYDAYGRMLVKDERVYYNAGVLLIDCDKWRAEKWRKRIENFIIDNQRRLAHPDQDIFNEVCRGEIALLPIRFNFQVIHREYMENLYFRYLAPKCYYSREEIQEARKCPCILHMIRALGTNPWYEDGRLHPDYAVYMHYKALSLWNGVPSKKMSQGFIIRCERRLKKVVPARVFFPLSLIAMRIAYDRDKTNKY